MIRLFLFCTTLLVVVINWVLIFLGLIKGIQFCEVLQIFYVALKVFSQERFAIFLWHGRGSILWNSIDLFWRRKWFSYEPYYLLLSWQNHCLLQASWIFIFLRQVHCGNLLISLPLSFSIIVVTFFFICIAFFFCFLFLC